MGETTRRQPTGERRRLSRADERRLLGRERGHDPCRDSGTDDDAPEPLMPWDMDEEQDET